MVEWQLVFFEVVVGDAEPGVAEPAAVQVERGQRRRRTPLVQLVDVPQRDVSSGNGLDLTEIPRYSSG